MEGCVVVSAVLKVTAVDRGVVVIQGTEAGHYLAMSDEGQLCSSVSKPVLEPRRADVT